MSVEVIVAIITSLFSLIGVIVTVKNGNSKTMYRIDQLEKKVDKHNSVVERTYILEEQIKVANHRIEDMERKIFK